MINPDKQLIGALPFLLPFGHVLLIYKHMEQNGPALHKLCFLFLIRI
jgi:hypothetical protein